MARYNLPITTFLWHIRISMSTDATPTLDVYILFYGKTIMKGVFVTHKY